MGRVGSGAVSVCSIFWLEVVKGMPNQGAACFVRSGRIILFRVCVVIYVYPRNIKIIPNYDKLR